MRHTLPRLCTSAAAFTLILSACGDPASDEAEELSGVTIGTHAVGGAFHTLGSGLAALVSSHTDLDAAVQPYSSPNAWMPELDDGTIQFGLASVSDIGWAVEAGPGFDEEATHLRIVLRGNELDNFGLVTTDDTGVESLEDLQGREVGSDYGAGVLNARLAAADLASVGLDWDDVTGVPVADAFTGLDSLRSGQTEATAGLASTTPDVAELDSAVGVRPLPFGGLTPEDLEGGVPEESQEIIDEFVPGTTLGVTEAGTGILAEDTVMYQYPLMLVTSEHTPPEVVEEVLAAVWEHHGELAEVHPWGAGWDPEAMATTDLQAPYHDGAVGFYEEAGAWTGDHEAAQQALSD